MTTIMEKYKYWKWTNQKSNNEVLKSLRKNLSNINEKQDESVDESGETEKKAPSRDLVNMVNLDTMHIEPSNKRSICNERISNRYMVIQTPINPFLMGSDYLYDLEIQDTLLRPKDSNTNKDVAK